MKFFYSLAILIILSNCSFDDKSGIWKNENDINKDEKDIIFKDFKKITSSTKIFEEIIRISHNRKINLDVPFANKSWTDNFYSKGNNSKNFKYTGLNEIVTKSKKLSRFRSNDYILYENDNLIFNDEKGNIIVYSKSKNTVISKINFYKKKYKNIKKLLNLIIEKNIIYVVDNIGYIYAFDINKNKVIWAKNQKIPFRSNLKISSDKIFTSNQNNDFLVFDKINGDLVKLIPSEETVINNSFINNIALSDSEIFFLNSYGSLYSIDVKNLKLNWFINLNNSLDLNLSNLFNGSKIIYNNNKIFLSSNENFYVLDSKSGSIIMKKNFSSSFKPLVNSDNIFVLTKNNFFVAMSLKNGKIIYSFDIGRNVANFINSKKKSLKIKNYMIVNNKIFFFLENSYVIKFNIYGELIEIIKLPSKLNTKPIFVEESLLYLNKKNKLLTVN